MKETGKSFFAESYHEFFSLLSNFYYQFIINKKVVKYEKKTEKFKGHENIDFPSFCLFVCLNVVECSKA